MQVSESLEMSTHGEVMKNIHSSVVCFDDCTHKDERDKKKKRKEKKSEYCQIWAMLICYFGKKDLSKTCHISH